MRCCYFETHLAVGYIVDVDGDVISHDATFTSILGTGVVAIVGKWRGIDSVFLVRSTTGDVCEMERQLASLDLTHVLCESPPVMYSEYVSDPCSAFP